MQTQKGSGLTVNDFNEGDTVVYIPKHKQGNHTLEDCEAGKVTSVNDTYVHVKYLDNNGEYKTNSQATYPNDLWHRI